MSSDSDETGAITSQFSKLLHHDPPELVEWVKKHWPMALAYEDITEPEMRNYPYSHVKRSYLSHELTDGNLWSELLGIQTILELAWVPYRMWPAYLIEKCATGRSPFFFLHGVREKRPSMSWMETMKLIIQKIGPTDFAYSQGRYIIDEREILYQFDDQQSIALKLIKAAVVTPEACLSEKMVKRRLSVLLENYVPSLAAVLKGMPAEHPLEDCAAILIDIVRGMDSEYSLDPIITFPEPLIRGEVFLSRHSCPFHNDVLDSKDVLKIAKYRGTSRLGRSS